MARAIEGIAVRAQAYGTAKVRAFGGECGDFLTVADDPDSADRLFRVSNPGVDGLAEDRRTHVIQSNVGEIRRRYDSLTAKEREVLSHVAAGEANKVIARRLDVSLRTVELHRQNVFQKMGADSLAELVRMVVAIEGKEK